MAAASGSGRFFGFILACCLAGDAGAALPAAGADPASTAEALPPATITPTSRIPKAIKRMVGLSRAERGPMIDGFGEVVKSIRPPGGGHTSLKCPIYLADDRGIRAGHHHRLAGLDDMGGLRVIRSGAG